MFRVLLRHGLVRVVGGKLVPALMVWDLAVLANKTRQIPIVDRSLRRGASAARDGLGSVMLGRSGRTRRREVHRDARRRPAEPGD